MKNTIKPTPLLSLDWLQGVIECKDELFIHMPQELTATQLPIKGKIFKQIWEVRESSTLIATLSFEPNSPILPPDMISIKFANGFLYCSNLKEKVAHYLDLMKCSLKYWSRIDIAHDFTQFYNHLHPNNFLKRLKRDIYLKCGYSKSTTIDTQRYQTEYHYLKYGTYNCDVSAKLYNKTLEMKEVALKKHICKSWELANFDIDDEMWRLEMNINNCRKYYLNKETGEVFDLNGMDILDNNNVALLYNYLVSKYFAFKINNYKKNKSRMRGLKLIDMVHWDAGLIEFESIAQAGKTDKIAAKAMYEHNKNVRTLTHPNENEFIYVLHQFLKDKGLEKWAKDKGYI